jgi:signal peptidase I
MASGLRVAWREWRSRRWASVSAKGTRSSRLLATGWRLPVAIVTAGIVGTALLKWLAVGVTYVPSMSMEPTLRVSDRVVVNKAAYLWSGPQRGDVVLVDGTRIAGSGIRTDLLRRVIGLPGDLISCQDGYFYRDGAKIEQPHTTADTSLACTDTTVPQGRLYLVGDNLHVAVDSRKFGTVPREAVLGRVVTGLIWRGFGSG